MSLPTREFKGRLIEVIDFDDVSSGEHVIEFRDPEVSAKESLVAVVVPDSGTWSGAKVSLNPRVPEVSAELMEWAISTARGMVN